VTTVAGLDAYDGEALTVLADGVQPLTAPIVAGGEITLATAASRIMAGFPEQVAFTSLKINPMMGFGPAGAILARQRVPGANVDLLATQAMVGVAGAAQLELFSARQATDQPGATARRAIKSVTFGGDTSRDPRIMITEESAYDFGIFAIKEWDATDGR
jgi:hypothetical protein